MKFRLPILLLCSAGLLSALNASAQEAPESPERPRTVGQHVYSFWQEFNQVWSTGEYQRFRAEYENDLFYNTDRNYTDGVRFTLKHGSDHPSEFDRDENPLIPPLRFREPLPLAERNKQLEEDEYRCAQPARNAAEYALGVEEMRKQTNNPDATESTRPYCYKSAYNVVLGHNMYTPSDIRLPSSRIPPKDRPYAAWAYIGINREVYSSDERYWRYGLDIGCMGPCAHGEQLQKWIHKYITDSPGPQGWDSQIHNELGIEFRYEHAWTSWRYGPARNDTKRPIAFGENWFGVPWALDLRPSVSVGLGNIQTYAGVGATARAGWFRPTYESLRLDTHPIESLAQADDDDDRLLPAVYAQADQAAGALSAQATANDGMQAPKRTLRPTRTPRVKSPPKPELFAFGRLNTNLVAYNALLQGGLFNTSSPKTADARPFIAEFEIGVAAAYREFSLSFSTVRRHEWEANGTRYGQRFGRITVEFSTRF